MALDTERKRRSALGIFAPIPKPDAAVNYQPDGRILMWLYAGILSEVAVAVAPVLEVLSSTFIHRRESFTGDGSTKAFVITLGEIEGQSEMVFLAGNHLQDRDTHYTVDSDRKTIRFILAPLNGEKIVVHYGELHENKDRQVLDGPERSRGKLHRREILTGDGVTKDFALSYQIFGQSEQLLSTQGYYERGQQYSVDPYRRMIQFTVPPLSGEKIAVHFQDANNN